MMRFTKIKGLSEIRRLPRLGKIRLGVKVISKKTGREYPRETDYFIVPPEVARVYGEQPKELDIMFPLNDVESVFPQAYKFYGNQKGLKCIGNGEIAMRLNDQGEMIQRECPCKLLDTGECSRRAHLLVILPRINMGGVYQIDIGSYHSIVDINSALDYIQSLIGRFALVPLKLRRTPRETYANEKRIHYPLQVVLDADLNMINALRENTTRIIESTRGIALPAVEDINPKFDEDAVVVEEEDNEDTAVVQQKDDEDGAAPAPSPQDEEPVTEQQKQALIRIAVKAGFRKEVVEKFVASLKRKTEAAGFISEWQRGNFIGIKTFADADDDEF